jgi:hypothetical protein
MIPDGLLGAAFVIGLPLVAMIMFIIAALLGFVIGSSFYKDMIIWGSAAGILAIMSLFGSRELRKKKRAARAV